MGKKTEYITAMQSLGILLVVLGHSYPLGVPFPKVYGVIHSYIYSFHMPLFVCISGFLLYYTGGIKHRYTTFMRKKTVRILLPYVVISTILYLPKVLLSRYALRGTDVSLTGFLMNIFYPHLNVLGHFWFLPVLFGMFVISPLILSFTNSNLRLVLGSAVCLALNLFDPLADIKLFGLAYLGKLLIFFWIGILIAKYNSHVERLFIRTEFFMLAIAIFLVLNAKWHSNAVTMLFAAGTGILMSFSFGHIYVRQEWNVLRMLDGYSYQIYLLHWPIEACTFIVVYRIAHVGWLTTCLSMFIVGLTASLSLVRLAVKYRYRINPVIGLPA